MRKSIFVTTTLVASTLSLSMAGGISQAQAGTLVPQEEGEIQLANLDVTCLSSINPKCINTNLGKNAYTVTSLNYDSQFSVSRLFVDKRSTVNDYAAFGIKFLADDEGTNPTVLQEYWLRPVAYSAPVTTKSNPTTSTKMQNGVTAPAGATVGTNTTKTSPTSTTTTDIKGNNITTDFTVVQTTVTREIQVDQKVTKPVLDAKGNPVIDSKTKQPKTQQVTIKVPKLVQDITTTTTTQKTTVTPPKAVENGRLEVGKFQFDFKNPLAGLEFNFFDVEDSKHTGILSYTNSKGESISINQLLTGGQNGNLQSLIIKDVQSFVVQLGNPGQKYGYNDSEFKNTGDGVDLQLKTVPEPGTTASLGFLTVVSVLGLRQRKKASHLA
jgi:hypothetical protein